MVQEPRHTEPHYSCTVSVDSLTLNQDEELVTFGQSAEDAKTEAEQLLISQYGCSQAIVEILMQQARIEPLAQWCSPQ